MSDQADKLTMGNHNIHIIQRLYGQRRIIPVHMTHMVYYD